MKAIVMHIVVAVGAAIAFTSPQTHTLAAEPTSTPTSAPTSTPWMKRTVLPEPVRVTLQLKDAPPKDAFEQLASAAVVELGDVPDEVWSQRAEVRVSLDAQRQTFLQALVELCRQCKLEPALGRMPDGRKSLLTLRLPVTRYPDGRELPKRLWVGGPSVSAGPYLTTLSRAHSQISTQIPAAEPRDKLRVSFDFVLLIDPSVDVVAVVRGFDMKEAIDERGRPLESSGGYASTDEPQSLQAMRPAMWSISLRPADADAQRLALLRGEVSVEVATRRELVEVKRPLEAKATTHTIAGMRLTIDPVKADGDAYEFRYTVFRDKRNGTEWTQLKNGLSTHGPRLVDEQGLPLYQLANNSRGSTGDQQVNWYRLGRDSLVPAPRRGEPARVVWSIASETKLVRVPIEFRDLPIPR